MVLAVATSMASRMLMKDSLGVTGSTQGFLKLAAAVGGRSIRMKYLQKTGYVPEDPWKDQ